MFTSVRTKGVPFEGAMGDKERRKRMARKREKSSRRFQNLLGSRPGRRRPRLEGRFSPILRASPENAEALEALLRWVELRDLESEQLDQWMPYLFEFFEQFHLREPGEPADEFLERWLREREDA